MNAESDIHAFLILVLFEANIGSQLSFLFQSSGILLPPKVFASAEEEQVGLLNKAAPHSGRSSWSRGQYLNSFDLCIYTCDPPTPHQAQGLIGTQRS